VLALAAVAALPAAALVSNANKMAALDEQLQAMRSTAFAAHGYDSRQQQLCCVAVVMILDCYTPAVQ
jgi:hypothetical protein